MLTPAGQGWLRGGRGGRVSPRTQGCGPGRCTHARLAPVYVGVGHTEGGAGYTGAGGGPLHSITQGDGARGAGVYRKGLQESLLFLLFFRKEGVRNFFFFLDGDLPGDPSLPASSAAGEAASSATWAGAGSAQKRSKGANISITGAL